MTAKLKIGILGTCGVCEGEFKTKNGKMVHHGYLRPGDGMIHGDCYAVHMLAYELSPISCQKYRESAELSKAGYESALSKLRSGETTQISVSRQHRPNVGPIEWITDVFNVGEPGWPQAYRRRCNELEYHLGNCVSTIERMTRRIDNWTLKPLREVTEAMAEAISKAEREKRAAERQAKKDEKSAKKRALEAKRAAKEELRSAHVAAFVEELKKCDPKTQAGLQHARFLASELRSPKNKRKFGEWYYLEDYILDEEKQLFLDLGLAERWEWNGKINIRV